MSRIATVMEQEDVQDLDCSPVSTSEISNSSRLHTSICSSASSESDLSFCLSSIDREVDTYSKRVIDELPVFEIRLISPLGRTPSPINSDLPKDEDGPRKIHEIDERLTPSPHRNNPNYVTLQDINAQISPPSDAEDGLSRTSSLETIFEGVFLNTPPRQRFSMQQLRSRTNFLEKVAVNRVLAGKENQSPLTRENPFGEKMSKQEYKKSESNT